jgi:aspergillopepsin I
MHALDLLLLAAALAGPVAGKPVLKKRSFKHHVRRSHNHAHPAAGGNAVFHSFRKYNFDLGDKKFVDTGVVRAAAATGSASTGSVANQPANNAAEYVSPVTIGGQTLVLDFDTGSSDL